VRHGFHAVLFACAASSVTAAARAQDSEPQSWPHPALALVPRSEQQAPAAPAAPQAQGSGPDAGGFTLASGGGASIAGALPVQQLSYFLQGVAGVWVAGAVTKQWSYRAYVLGSVSYSSAIPSTTTAAISPEQITVSYSPIENLSFQIGYMRIPFSIAQDVVITQSMFPNRPAPTSVFQQGADAGLLGTYAPVPGILQLKLGVFDGLSLGLLVPNAVTRGPVFSGFVEVTPFGAMPPLEGDLERGKLRLSIGTGAIYRSATVYDATGYDALHTRDLRLSGALRAAWLGLFVQGEVLRRVETDDLSQRPSTATGTYAQGSYFFPVTKRIGLAPIARVGYSNTDEVFAPNRVVSLEAGLALYPHAETSQPGLLRVVVEYTQENRVDLRETSRGGLTSAMLVF
jgi:hypothetical protein